MRWSPLYTYALNRPLRTSFEADVIGSNVRFRNNHIALVLTCHVVAPMLALAKRDCTPLAYSLLLCSPR